MESRKSKQAALVASTSADASDFKYVPTVTTHAGAYPYRLNFYDRPPLHNITLEEFEGWAIDRLRVLSEIEASIIRNRSYEDLKSVTLAQCNKYLPLHSNTAHGQPLEQERKKDHVSHFVLRLAFCRSHDLRERFLKAESTLFRIRYESDDTGERDAFLQMHSSIAGGGEEVSPEEKAGLGKKLMDATPGLTAAKLAEERFYKVHWTQVPDLVATRKVLLQRGYAFVPSSLRSSIIFQSFQTHISDALDLTSRSLPRIGVDEDDRLIPILNHLSQGFVGGVGAEYTGDEDGETVRAEDVDDLARKHFPPCMRSLHEVLRRDKHLKHFGRQQYGLFLKALGLSIDEALTFWRKSFSLITDDKFNKEYRYNIRHNFGLEGRRMNYPAKTCQRILTSDQPGTQDTHGCPFRHFSPESLQLSLQTYYSVTPADMSDVMSAVKGGHYHIACTRVFEITHANRGVKKGDGIGGGESVSHPNAYTARSRELAKEAEVKAKEKKEGKTDAMDVDEPVAT